MISFSWSLIQRPAVRSQRSNWDNLYARQRFRFVELTRAHVTHETSRRGEHERDRKVRRFATWSVSRRTCGWMRLSSEWSDIQPEWAWGERSLERMTETRDTRCAAQSPIWQFELLSRISPLSRHEMTTELDAIVRLWFRNHESLRAPKSPQVEGWSIRSLVSDEPRTLRERERECESCILMSC